MSMMGGMPPSQGTAGVTDVVTALQGIIRQLSAWVMAFNGRASMGSVTLAAAATTVVLQPAVAANSNINLTATNASAGALIGSAKSPYISAISPGISFTIATANGVAAAGTETFNYIINTPS